MAERMRSASDVQDRARVLCDALAQSLGKQLKDLRADMPEMTWKFGIVGNIEKRDADANEKFTKARASKSLPILSSILAGFAPPHGTCVVSIGGPGGADALRIAERELVPRHVCVIPFHPGATMPDL